jgi:hypothetical protein
MKKTVQRLASKACVGGAALCLLSAISPAVAATSVDDLARQLADQQQLLSNQQKVIEQLQKDLAATKSQEQQVEAKQAAVEQKAAETALDPSDDSLSYKPSAASKVTLYGGIDVGLVYQRNNGGPGLTYKPNHSNYFGFIGSGEHDSNLGLKGEYKLSPDYKLGFDMLSSVSTTGSGMSPYPTWSPFNKAFNLSVDTPYGKIIGGTQLDPAWQATTKGDPDEVKNLLSATAGAWSFGQGTISGNPQWDMGPSNALGYSLDKGAVHFGALFRPSSNSNASATQPFAGNHAAGQQESAGVTYDDKTYLLTAGYMQKFGTGTGSGNAPFKGLDVRNYSLAAGYYLGDWLFKTGIVDVYEPHGVWFAGFTGQPNITNKSDVRVYEEGAKWSITEKDILELSYYKTIDEKYTRSGADWYVIGYNHKFTKRLTYWTNIGMLRAKAGSNALTDSTAPSMVAAPGTDTFTAGSGFLYKF